MSNPGQPSGAGSTDNASFNEATAKHHKVHHKTVSQTSTPLLADWGDIVWEPPHAHQLWHQPLMKGSIGRGYIVQNAKDDAIKSNPGKRPLGLSFLYNPTEVDVSYTMNTSIFPSGAAPGTDVSLIGVPGSSQISWSLILDRTYEVNTDGAIAYSEGVMADIHQFEEMMGFTSAIPFIQPVSMFVVFGNLVQKYYGYIDSWDATITNWTQDMRPYRAALDITMQILPDGSKKKGKFLTSTSNLGAAGGGKGKAKSGGGGKGGNSKDSGNGKSQKSGGGKSKAKAVPLPTEQTHSLTPVHVEDMTKGMVLYTDGHGVGYYGTVKSFVQNGRGGLVTLDNGKTLIASGDPSFFFRSLGASGNESAEIWLMVPEYPNEVGPGDALFTGGALTGFIGVVSQVKVSKDLSSTAIEYVGGKVETYSNTQTYLWVRNPG